MRRNKPGGPQAELLDVETVHAREWVGLPSYHCADLAPHHTIKVHFETVGDIAAIVKAGVRIPEKDRTAWFPWAERDRYSGRRRITACPPSLPRYPVYIISKGRADSRLTALAFDRMGAPFHIVIEPQEYDDYAAVIDPANILVLPFSNLGQGSIPARNWVWDHATAGGHARHWILDDNLRAFFRLDDNLKTPVADATVFRALEDLVDRYTNVPMAGFNYEMFAPRKQALPPFYLNTRVYSCILLSNSDKFAGYRWRGRYNEDTDLSLRFLKAGFCTILTNAFLCDKMTTMTMTGGNTEDLYEIEEGRRKMAQSLVDQHPDVTTITWKWGRWQHQVDYRSFARNRLKRTPEFEAVASSLPLVNQYGMAIEERTGKDEPWVRAGSGEEATSLAPEASLQPPEKQAAPVVDTTQTELF
jgi:hypothetical protein